MKPSEVDRYWRGQAVDYIAGSPVTFVVVTIKRLLLLVSAYEIPDDLNLYFMERFSWMLRFPLFTFGLFLAPLAAAGVYLGWVERPRFAMLYVLLGAYALSIVFFFVFGRYRLPMVPLLLVFAAHAVVKSAQLVHWQMRQVPKTAAAVFAVTLVAVNALPYVGAVTGHRDFRTAHRNLGAWYYENERYAEAADEFEKAKELDPESLPAYLWPFAQACDKSGRQERAFELYDMAAKMDVVSPDPPYRVGLIYLTRGMNERAAGALAEAVRRDPRFIPAYVPLAEAHVREKRPQAALKALEAAAAAAPGDWSIRLKRAEVLRGLGMEKEASAEEAEAARIREASRRQR
jgi:tetratricopeptide (TPR) repeat protein